MYNILICDDERDIVNALKIYLADPEYRLYEAYTGKEAAEIVERENIHLVLNQLCKFNSILEGNAALSHFDSAEAYFNGEACSPPKARTQTRCWV